MMNPPSSPKLRRTASHASSPHSARCGADPLRHRGEAPSPRGYQRLGDEIASATELWLSKGESMVRSCWLNWLFILELGFTLGVILLIHQVRELELDGG